MFCATKDAVLKIEILVYEIIGKFGRGGVDEMPAQIRFPIIEWCGRESGVGRFEEFRLLHVDVARLNQIDAFEIIRPIPVGRQRLEILLSHLVVVFLRIAEFDACARGLGEQGFERHDLFRVIGSFVLGLAEQRQHFGNMIEILVA